MVKARQKHYLVPVTGIIPERISVWRQLVTPNLLSLKISPWCIFLNLILSRSWVKFLLLNGYTSYIILGPGQQVEPPALHAQSHHQHLCKGGQPVQHVGLLSMALVLMFSTNTSTLCGKLRERNLSEKSGKLYSSMFPRHPPVSSR